MNYYEKYLKYKIKYLSLKEQMGGKKCDKTDFFKKIKNSNIIFEKDPIKILNKLIKLSEKMNENISKYKNERDLLINFYTYIREKKNSVDDILKKYNQYKFSSSFFSDSDISGFYQIDFIKEIVTIKQIDKTKLKNIYNIIKNNHKEYTYYNIFNNKRHINELIKEIIKFFNHIDINNDDINKNPSKYVTNIYTLKLFLVELLKIEHDFNTLDYFYNLKYDNLTKIDFSNKCNINQGYMNQGYNFVKFNNYNKSLQDILTLKLLYERYFETCKTNKIECGCYKIFGKNNQSCKECCNYKQSKKLLDKTGFDECNQFCDGDITDIN